jgi:hypothetical protein
MNLLILIFILTVSKWFDNIIRLKNFLLFSISWSASDKLNMDFVSDFFFDS